MSQGWDILLPLRSAALQFVNFAMTDFSAETLALLAPLVIGVTGHRDLRPEDQDELKKKVRHILRGNNILAESSHSAQNDLGGEFCDDSPSDAEMKLLTPTASNSQVNVAAQRMVELLYTDEGVNQEDFDTVASFRAAHAYPPSCRNCPPEATRQSGRPFRHSLRSRQENDLHHFEARADSNNADDNYAGYWRMSRSG
jgi:hypothetical protein